MIWWERSSAAMGHSVKSVNGDEIGGVQIIMFVADPSAAQSAPDGARSTSPATIARDRISARTAKRSVGRRLSEPRIADSRRKQSAFAVGGEHDSGFIKMGSIPKLAGDLAMALVQRLAVIGVQAQTHTRAAAFANFQKPIRIRQCLAGESDYVRCTDVQRLFRLIKMMYAAGEHDGRVESSLADFRTDA